MKTGAGQPTERQARAARTATELKAAARAVFARQGYLNAKIADITQEAGRAAGSFYNHFASKEDVLAALAADVAADADRIASAQPVPGARLTRYAVTRAHLAVFWHAYSAHRDIFSAVEQAVLVSPAFAGQMRQFEDEQLRPWSEWLARLAAGGAQLPAAPEATARIIQATAKAMISSWEGEPEAGIDALAIFVSSGLRRG